MAIEKPTFSQEHVITMVSVRNVNLLAHSYQIILAPLLLIAPLSLVCEVPNRDYSRTICSITSNCKAIFTVCHIALNPALALARRPSSPYVSFSFFWQTYVENQ